MGRTSFDEALRALEKNWRSLATDIRQAGGGGCSNAKATERERCADELVILIAELGQEVGAVPNGKLVGWWNGITPGFDGMGVPSVRWGADAENSRHDIPLYDGYNPIHYVTPPSSPAHTSEARDAARYRFVLSKGKLPIRCSGGYYYEDGVMYPTANDAIDSAMSQGGGNG